MFVSALVFRTIANTVAVYDVRARIAVLGPLTLPILFPVFVTKILESDTAFSEAVTATLGQMPGNRNLGVPLIGEEIQRFLVDNDVLAPDDVHMRIRWVE